MKKLVLCHGWSHFFQILVLQGSYLNLWSFSLVTKGMVVQVLWLVRRCHKVEIIFAHQLFFFCTFLVTRGSFFIALWFVVVDSMTPNIHSVNISSSFLYFYLLSRLLCPCLKSSLLPDNFLRPLFSKNNNEEWKQERFKQLQTYHIQKGTNQQYQMEQLLQTMRSSSIFYMLF